MVKPRLVGLVLACVLLSGAAGLALAGGGVPPPPPPLPLPPPPPPPPPPPLPPPSGIVITEFTAVCGDDNIWTFTGQVEDPDGSTDITVYFGNMPSLVGQSAIVNPDGSFMLIVQLGENETGYATAMAMDDEGDFSDVVGTFIF